MALHAIELILDPASDAAVRRLWVLLAEAGLPSQAAHTGATNAPHVTLVSAPLIGADTEAVAERAFAPLLPVEAPLSGLLTFGTRRPTLALGVDVPVPMRAARDLVAATLADPAGLSDPSGPWVAHVTLARRFTPAQHDAALGVLSGATRLSSVRLAGLRRWDPDARTVRRLV